MATRKQKHAAAVAKRENYMEDLRTSGLKALRQDRIERTEQKLKDQEEAHQKHHRFEAGCLHCDIIRKALAKGEDIRPKSRRSSDKKPARKQRSKDKSPDRRTDGPKITADLSNPFSTEIEDNASVEMECV